MSWSDADLPEFLGDPGPFTSTEFNEGAGTAAVSSAAAEHSYPSYELQPPSGTGAAIELFGYSANVAANDAVPARREDERGVDEKLKRQRELNRAAQARIRERKLAASASLERNIAAMRSRVAEKTAEVRGARALKDKLTERANDAADALIAHLSSKTLTLPPPPSSLAHPHQRQPTGALVATAHARRGLHTPRSSEQRPVATFTMHAALHYAAIADHARLHYPREHTLLDLSSSPRHDGDDGANLKAHVKLYQAAVAQQRGVATGDVCWYVQLPYEVSPGLDLSLSPQLGSPECVASLAVNHMLSLLECMLITYEREELTQQRLIFLGATDAPEPQRPGAADCPRLPSLTTAPLGAACTATAGVQQAAAYLRCGVGEVAVREDATRHMLRSLLSKYTATLPHAKLERAIGNMIAHVEHLGGFLVRVQPLAAAGAPPAPRWDEPWREAATTKILVDMGAAMLDFHCVLKQDRLQAAAERDSAVGWKLRSFSCVQDVDACLAENGARLLTLQRGKLLCKCVCLMHAPRLIRQVEGGGVCLDIYCGATVVQIEELNLAIFRALRLSASQRRELAKVWLTWQQLRRILDDKLLHAAKPLEELPSAACVSPAWRTFIASRAGCEAGAGVWEANEEAGEALKWAENLVGASAARTAIAERAVSGLRQFLDEDAEAYAYTVMLRNSPGKCVTSDQFAMYFAVQMERRILLGDWFRIAALAAQELRQSTLLATGSAECCPSHDIDEVAPRAVQEAWPQR